MTTREQFVLKLDKWVTYFGLPEKNLLACAQSTELDEYCADGLLERNTSAEDPDTMVYKISGLGFSVLGISLTHWEE